MNRRNFLKDTCKACLLSAAAFSMADVLDACGTTMKGFKTSVNNNRVEVPLTLFATSELQIISPKNYEYEIAVRKNADNTYEALLMRCNKGIYCCGCSKEFSAFAGAESVINSALLLIVRLLIVIFVL